MIRAAQHHRSLVIYVDTVTPLQCKSRAPVAVLMGVNRIVCFNERCDALPDVVSRNGVEPKAALLGVGDVLSNRRMQQVFSFTRTDRVSTTLILVDGMHCSPRQTHLCSQGARTMLITSFKMELPMCDILVLCTHRCFNI